LKHELESSLNRFSDKAAEPAPEAWIARQIKRYLNWKHVQAPEGGCAVPCLAAEVARADMATREAFERAQLDVHALWASNWETINWRGQSFASWPDRS